MDKGVNDSDFLESEESVFFGLEEEFDISEED